MVCFVRPALLVALAWIAPPGCGSTSSPPGGAGETAGADGTDGSSLTTADTATESATSGLTGETSETSETSGDSTASTTTSETDTSSDGDDTSDTGNDGPEVLLLQYNLYGWNALVQESWKAENIIGLINMYSPDFLTAQECEGQCESVRQQLIGNYEIAGAEEHGVAIFYDADVWTLQDQGVEYLAEMDQWGQRIARWGYFEHQETGDHLYVYDTHWCVCSEAQLFGSAQTVATAIAGRPDPTAPVVFGGDLNVFDGLEDSDAILHIKGQLGSPIEMLDTFRVLNPKADGSTYAAAGKIDYLFATPDLEVLSSSIDRETINPGEGSDHDPVLATVRL